MKINLSIAVLFVVSTLTGCQSMNVTTEFTFGRTYDQYQTYQWQSLPQAVANDTHTHRNPALKKALNKEFAIKGIKASDTPDLKVLCYMQLHEEYGYTSENDHKEPHQLSGGISFSNTKNISYKTHDPALIQYQWEVATIVARITEAKTGQKLWEGKLTTPFDRSEPAEKQEKKIAQAVERLMGYYPPRH